MRWVDEVTLKRRVKCVGSPISCLLDDALPHGYRIFDDFHKLKFVFHRKIRGDFKKVSSRVIDVGLKTFWLHSSRRSSATIFFFFSSSRGKPFDGLSFSSIAIDLMTWIFMLLCPQIKPVTHWRDLSLTTRGAEYNLTSKNMSPVKIVDSGAVPKVSVTSQIWGFP